MDWNHIVFFAFHALIMSTVLLCVCVCVFISPLQEQHLFSKYTNNFQTTYVTTNFHD
jgi:hypothetical protein